VQWADQDWKLVAPPGGSWEGTVKQVTGTEGYTRLSAAEWPPR
jgi:hypothetical protein